MTFVAEPVRADCCCRFDQLQTEGRTITVQARCDGCPQHGLWAQHDRHRKTGEPTEGDPA